MSLVAFDPDIRVCFAIVSLGTPQRLLDCIASLTTHVSRHEFSVICVVNSAEYPEPHRDLEIADEIEVVFPGLNLGWPGGLHVARERTNAQYLVWVQEDMTVRDGWLDALVDAADDNPDIAAFGSVSVDIHGLPAGISCGQAEPPHDVSRWNETYSSERAQSAAIVRADWVTSNGLLTRTAAWDDIGGADPSQFPLNLVDKDYCTHLRAHGYSVALVPEARLHHLQSQSAPSMFRRFVSEYRDPHFNARWGDVAARLATEAGPVAHDCKPWYPGTTQTDAPVAAITAIAAREASTMLIAFAKWANTFVDISVEHQANVDRHEASLRLAASESKISDLERQLASLSDLAPVAAPDSSALSSSEVEAIRQSTADAYETTWSWRITRPLRAIRRRLT